MAARAKSPLRGKWGGIKKQLGSEAFASEENSAKEAGTGAAARTANLAEDIDLGIRREAPSENGLIHEAFALHTSLGKKDMAIVPVVTVCQVNRSTCPCEYINLFREPILI